METRLRAFHNSRSDSSTKSEENSALPVEVRHALSAWIRAKQSLQRVMPREDFHSFVRPMYLVAVLSESFMLLALPPNKRLFERARAFRGNIEAAIGQQNYHFAGIARYPSNDELVILRDSPSFAPFVDLIWRKRLAKLEVNRPAEDERDRADLTEALREVRA
jgi:hypothetical protein